MRTLPPRRPDARARVGTPAGRRVPAQVRAEHLGGRGGGRLLRAQRRRADEELQAPRDRPADGLRDPVREVPGGRAGSGRGGVRRARGRGDRRRTAPHGGGHGRARACDSERLRVPPAATGWSRSSASSSSSRPRSRRCMCPTSTARSTRNAPSASSGRRSGRSASGTPTYRLTSRATPPAGRDSSPSRSRAPGDPAR